METPKQLQTTPDSHKQPQETIDDKKLEEQLEKLRQECIDFNKAINGKRISEQRKSKEG